MFRAEQQPLCPLLRNISKQQKRSDATERGRHAEWKENSEFLFGTRERLVFQRRVQVRLKHPSLQQVSQQAPALNSPKCHEQARPLVRGPLFTGVSGTGAVTTPCVQRRLVNRAPERDALCALLHGMCVWQCFLPWKLTLSSFNSLSHSI